MSIINSSYDFVFVHIPKAAGTSVSRHFSKHNSYCDLEIGGTSFGEAVQPAYRKRFGLSKHSTSSTLKNVMGAVAWNKALSFTFVRDPYTRVASTYNFLCGWPGCPDDLREELLRFGSLSEYVLSDIWARRAGPDDIFLPQTHWTSDSRAPENVLVDYVAKMENIDHELAELDRMIGVKTVDRREAAPELNRSSSRYCVSDLSDDAIEKINFHYRSDFEIFGYDVRSVRVGTEPALS